MHQQSWVRRGKEYRAKTLAALKDLYGNDDSPKPGNEPKGIKNEPQKDRRNKGKTNT